MATEGSTAAGWTDMVRPVQSLCMRRSSCGHGAVNAGSLLGLERAHLQDAHDEPVQLLRGWGGRGWKAGEEAASPSSLSYRQAACLPPGSRGAAGAQRARQYSCIQATRPRSPAGWRWCPAGWPACWLGPCAAGAPCASRSARAGGVCASGGAGCREGRQARVRTRTGAVRERGTAALQPSTRA